MQQLVTGSFQLMKSLNRSLILNIIRDKGPISRAEIAKQTNLTPPTVGNLVKELLSSGLIIETDLGSSSGGRKPTLLEINAKHFYLIGLDVGSNSVKCILTDLNAHILDRYVVQIPKRITGNDLLQLMKTCIYHLVQENRLESNKLMGIGVGIHGIVDVVNGISLFIPTFDLKNIPIKQELEKEFEVIVKIENDAKAMTLGEYWFGSAQGADNCICVNVGRGIGAGILLNGKLFHGEHFISGEIAHLTLDIDGPVCTCGNHGCLETFSSGMAIEEKARKEVAIGKQSIISDLADGDINAIDGKMIFEAAKQGDSLAIDLFSQAGVYLGIALTGLIHTLNPKRVIIGGGVSKSGDFLLNSLKKTVRKRVLIEKAKETEIVLSKLGDDATATGAVTLILEELFQPHSVASS